MRILCCLTFVFIVSWAAAAVEQMGKKYVDFVMAQQALKTFSSGLTAEELHEDEVVRLTVQPTGRKGQRPSESSPVSLFVMDRSRRHTWQLPWRPGGGALLQDVEALLCTNQPTVTVVLQKNTSQPLPLRMRVSTENVALSNGITMTSRPSDISYKRYRWYPDSAAIEVDVDIQTMKGESVCASLVVATVCEANPYRLMTEHVLQRVRFSRRAQITVSRADTADGFWLYLIPEHQNTLCEATAGRGQDSHGPAGKTIRVFKTERAFAATVAPRRPDWETLPRGGAVGTSDGDWAQPPDSSACSARVAQLEQELRQCRG